MRTISCILSLVLGLSANSFGKSFVCKDFRTGSLYVTSVNKETSTIVVGTYSSDNELLVLHSGKYEDNTFGYIGKMKEGQSLILIVADGSIHLKMTIDYIKIDGPCGEYPE